MSDGRANYAYAAAFAAELARCGVRHVCLAPGSRSAPLALALARQPGMRVWTHVDERSAAFFALGMARALGAPVAVLCTSGTAAANFYPAVIEARYGRVPLVVLTADRPHELRDVGAPQAIDQLGLYGRHVRWFSEMAPPEAGERILAYARAAARRAVATAQAPPAGPVHLNFPFREPLVPPPEELDQLDAAASVGPDTPPQDASGPAPWPDGMRWLGGRRTLGEEAVGELARRLAGWRRGLVVCGPQEDGELPAAALRLAGCLGFPVLADPLSGVRCGPYPGRELVVDAYDLFLRAPGLAAGLRPEVVLRVGAVPVSRVLQEYLQRHAEAYQILVDGGGEWRDPLGVVREVIHADAAWLLSALADAVAARGRVADRAGPNGSEGWLASWRQHNETARRAAGEALVAMSEPFEGQVFARLAEVLPDGATLVVGNSMPVRDLDAFFPATPRRIRCLANRGASGIDGVVSTALGVAAAGTGPVVLAIGDLSFYHDLNGLLAARLHGLSLTVVLVHNDGGGIFHFLPQARHRQHFETLFGTPTGLDFRPVVEMYGGRFVVAGDGEELARAVQEGLARGGLWVVQVTTDRLRNVEQHRRVWQAVTSAVEGPGGWPAWS